MTTIPMPWSTADGSKNLSEMDSFYFSDDFFSAETIEKLQENLKANKGHIPAEVLATIVIQAIIVTVGIGANLLVAVVTVFGNTRQHESSTITYVANLSISSIVFLATVPFKLSEEVHLEWVHGQAFCQITTFIKFLNFSLVALFLMAMGVDRYIAVIRPISSGHMRSVRVSRIASVILWLCSLAGAFPLALHQSTDRDSRCSPKFPGQQASINLTALFLQNNTAQPPMCKYRSWSTSFTTWTIAYFIYSFFIPFVAIIICYSAIIRRIRTPTASSTKSPTKNSYNEIVKKKVTQMSLLLVASYTVCYVPYHLWQLLSLVGIPVTDLLTCFRMQRFNTTMAYINSALHPILYVFASGQFSKQYRLVKRKLGFCGPARDQPHSIVSQHTKRTIVKSNAAEYGAEKRNPSKQPLIVDANRSSILPSKTNQTNNMNSTCL